MTELFLYIVNRSISAGWLVLAILVLRQLLKKAPRWLHVVLWGLVGMRLAVPFSIESIFSLIPSSETISPDVMQSRTPTVNTGIQTLDRAVNPIISTSLAPAPAASANPLQVWVPVCAVIWIMGMFCLFSYSVMSYWRLRMRVAAAVPMQDHIYQSERVASPFVLGIIHPRIYLPFCLTEKDALCIIAHEQAHMRRRDHWWKPLGFLLLVVYWFHPLMWPAYVLFCRDIELACDEKAIRNLDREQRADYSQALLACSVSHKSIAACPLAFGEAGVKERVRCVLYYRKPAFWIIVVSAAVCMAAALCFLTDPVRKQEPESGKNVDIAEDTKADDEADITANTVDNAAMIESKVPVNELPDSIGNAAAVEGQFPADILPLEFLFASGASSSGTLLTLYPDGRFEGVYEDGENIATAEYPRGTRYICRFSGRFGEIRQISDYAYSMQMKELTYDTEVDQVWIEDQVRYIGADANGLEGGEEFIFYLPGTSLEGLDKDFLFWWPDYYLWVEGVVDHLSSYGIWNVNTGDGFFTSWLE